MKKLQEYSLRAILLALTLFGMIGLAVELVLLRHTDSAAKLIPLIVLAAGFVFGAQLAVHPSRGVIRAFQLMMVVFLVSGLLGLYFHFKGNVEFALERYPSATGMQLTKAQRDAIYAKLWMPIDLNKATDQEILMIPGIGPRMLHEFKEYRPYTAMDTFRREIGKYVDKDEVARLEKYIRI